ncbi:MAG: exopolysaccharide biosynthesis protein [Acidobacteriia bacterium]|nr:exopolysaccharide biosynthesis protein [Terriglobia bacterium]
MVDIHSHILPEVDDGAQSWEMAVHMCHMAAQDGIEHMVATPHANGEFAYDRRWLRSLLDELRQRTGDKPKLSLGCDFHFSYENLESLAQTPHLYTIEDTPYLLVEFSDFSVPPSVTDELEDLLRRGLIPIITHPERNLLLQRMPERVLDWVRLGCAVQVTASAVTGLWGDRAKKIAQWLLDREAVHILATDSHSVEGRPPILSAARDAISRVYRPSVARALTDDNPRAVVTGQPLPYFPRI